MLLKLSNGPEKSRGDSRRGKDKKTARRAGPKGLAKFSCYQARLLQVDRGGDGGIAYGETEENTPQGPKIGRGKCITWEIRERGKAEQRSRRKRVSFLHKTHAR